jgi:hypothetical protein
MLILADKRRTKFVSETVERFNYQTKYSDGEVYRKIRHYQRDDPTMVQDWMIRLTECKQVNLKQILKNQDLSRALDKLLIFPGLWCGLELSHRGFSSQVINSLKIFRYIQCLAETTAHYDSIYSRHT